MERYAKKKFWIEIAKIIVSFAMIPMYFIKFIHESAYLPTENGEVIHVDYFYSIYDKFSREGLSLAVWCVVTATIASIALYVLNILRKGSFGKGSTIIFIIQVVFFLIIIYISVGVFAYKY